MTAKDKKYTTQPSDVIYSFLRLLEEKSKLSGVTQTTEQGELNRMSLTAPKVPRSSHWGVTQFPAGSSEECLTHQKSLTASSGQTQSTVDPLDAPKDGPSILQLGGIV